MSVEQDLLAAVYADPSNDEPRLVYMDWLAERGDPRGELIGLQLARYASSSHELPRKEARREQELLDAHMLEWLGELQPIIAVDTQQALYLHAAERQWPVPPVFERGFLAAATIPRAPMEQHPELARSPLLATAVELCGAVQTIPCEELPGLRRLRPHGGGPPSELLAWMDLVVRAPHLERISCSHTAVIRRDGALVVRISARYQIVRDKQNWFEGLFERHGAGWLLEFVTMRDVPAAVHAQQAKTIKGLARELPTFAVTHIIDDAV